LYKTNIQEAKRKKERMFSIKKSSTLIVIISISLLGLFTINAFINTKPAVAPTRSDTSLNFFPNPFEKKSDVPIIDAVNTKNKNLIQQLISEGKLNDVDSNGNTAMHIIAKKGHYQYPPADIPKMLIDGGIDINKKNNEQRTALEISLLSGWQKISYLLLDANADRTVVTKEVVDRITCPDCKKLVREYKLIQ